jgi:hypothetical protein
LRRNEPAGWRAVGEKGHLVEPSEMQPLQEASSLVARSSRVVGGLMRRLPAVEFFWSEINRLKITDGYSYSGEGKGVTKNGIGLYAWSPRGSGELKLAASCACSSVYKFGRFYRILVKCGGLCHFLKKLVLFIKKSVLFIKNRYYLSKKLVQTSNSATSNFFHSTKFWNTDLQTEM